MVRPNLGYWWRRAQVGLVVQYHRGEGRESPLERRVDRLRPARCEGGRRKDQPGLTGRPRLMEEVVAPPGCLS